MDLRKKLLNKLQPVLTPLYDWYTSRPRKFRYKNIQIIIFPGVFHPGLFFSTKVILRFLETTNLNGKHVLELGAGSGLISIFCASNGARVTSSDISDRALNCVRENARMNKVGVNIVKSDLLDELMEENFDLIVINPPYYARKINSEADYGWFCGEDFEYFRKLFHQLHKVWSSSLKVIMNLSEDCKIDTIRSIAAHNDFILKLELETSVAGEKNFLFEIRRG